MVWWWSKYGNLSLVSWTIKYCWVWLKQIYVLLSSNSITKRVALYKKKIILPVKFNANLLHNAICYFVLWHVSALNVDLLQGARRSSSTCSLCFNMHGRNIIIIIRLQVTISKIGIVIEIHLTKEWNAAIWTQQIHQQQIKIIIHHILTIILILRKATFDLHNNNSDHT